MNNVCDVIKKRCVKCGTCIGVCSQNAISKVYSDKKGCYEISIDKTKCISCGMCRKVCPAITQNFVQREERFIGNYKKIFLAAAKDESARENATSGGVIHTIVKYSISQGYIDCAYMLGHMHDNPMQVGMYKINEENIKLLEDNRNFASRYVSYPVNEVLGQLNGNEKILIVGTPCQINGIRKYLDIHKGLNVLLCGIACSGAVNYKASEMAQKKLTGKNKDEFCYFYRGKGWPGENEVIFHDGSGKGEKHLSSYFNALFSSKVFTNTGCRYCTDQLAEQADISCFDFWNKDEIATEKIGKSGVIIRTEKGLKLFAEIEQYVFTYRELTEEEVIRSQNIPIRYKKRINHQNLPFCIKLYYFASLCIFKTGVYKFLPKNFFRKMSNLYNKMILKITEK